MSRLYRARTRIERALIAYGKRYNYLSSAPPKLRDTSIDVEGIFNATSD
jgi:hypothetical protein